MVFLHVGFKVNDIYKSSELYRALFGIDWEPIKEYSLNKISLDGKNCPSRTLVTHGKTASGFEIEMIQCLEGEVADDIVLQGREGLSHLAFLVDDIDAAAAVMTQRGLKSVSEYRSDYVDFTFFASPDLGGALTQLVHFNRPRT
jgi:catechol 2,3-dioxygenase-like lactoylglutathione lyase family enzyme